MTIIDRYIFRNASIAFLSTLSVLTAVMWITSAMREFSVMTQKKQSFMVFLSLTGLTIPALITIITPFAVFIGTIYALNRLHDDSELIVMSAAGVSPARIARPFLFVALIASVLVGWMTLSLMPASFRAVRDVLVQIQADFLARIVRPGAFTQLEQGMVFHYRDRAGPAMIGVFMRDKRDPQRPTVYIADRGIIVERDKNVYLVLENGNVQREGSEGKDASIVKFERYALDLSQFSNEPEVIKYKPRERTTADLLDLDEDEWYVQANRGRFRSELHDRFAGPLYPLALVAIALATLGTARTTRQGRSSAMGLAIVLALVVRVGGFAMSSIANRTALAVPLMYLVPLLAIVVGLTLAMRPDLVPRLRWPAAGRSRLRPSTA